MIADRLRALLPGIADGHFLNYAATAPMTAPASEAMARIAREGLRPLGEHFGEWLARIEGVRRDVADTIGAGPDEIAFVPNTSTGLSVIAGAVRWRDGDRVLYPADEFPSNRFVWDQLRDLGVRAEAVPVERDVSFDRQLARADLARVRLVALSAVSYRDGRRHDVAAISALCRARGVLVSVDAIQAVGAVPVDVRAWGADFLACGGQKWLLGPIGSGFVWLARERIAELRVPLVGWASSRHAGEPEAPTLEFADGATRFEPGLPDIAAIAGLGASLAALREVGRERIFGAIAGRRERIAADWRSRGFELLHDGPAGACAGIVAARIPGGAASRVERSLAARRVVATLRSGTLRVAAHAATTDADLAALSDALDDALGAGARAAVPARDPGESGPVTSTPSSGGGATWRSALVTGASRGLGAEIARALAAEGCAVTLLGRDGAALAGIAAELHDRHAVEATVARVDLGDAPSLRAWLDAERTRLSELDLLVHCAAHAGAARFVDGSEATERAALEANYFAPLALTRAALPGMLARGRGAVLDVVTSGARNALPLFSAYAASKGALWAWSEALGRELDGTGVSVTTFVPPHMDTATHRQLGRRALADYDVAGGKDETTPVAIVAARALAAVRAGRPLVAPWSTRWALALNALTPARVAAAVRRRWRGSRPRG